MIVEIENFQSIKKVRLNIDGFTVLVGKTNIGKSSIIRAIRAALNNLPADSYVRHGEKAARVSIEHNGLKLVWEKGSGGTKYTINGKEYPKAGRGVPDYLTEALQKHGLAPLQVGNETFSPHIATQFNPVFLLDKHGGVIADALSQVSRVDVVSDAISVAQKDLYSTNKQISYDTKEKDRITERVKDFDLLPSVVETVAKQTSLVRSLQSTDGEIATVQTWLETIKDHNERIVRLKEITEVEVPPYALDSVQESVEECQSFLSDMEQIDESIKRLLIVLEIELPDDDLDVKEILNLQKYVEELDETNQRIDQLSGVASLELEDFDATEYLDELEMFRDWINSLELQDQRITGFTEKVDSLENEVSDIEEEHKKLIEESGGICPVCDREWDGTLVC